MLQYFITTRQVTLLSMCFPERHCNIYVIRGREVPVLNRSLRTRFQVQAYFFQQSYISGAYCLIQFFFGCALFITHTQLPMHCNVTQSYGSLTCLRNVNINSSFEPSADTSACSFYDSVLISISFLQSSLWPCNQIWLPSSTSEQADWQRVNWLVVTG